jgi:hypothetical protein
LTVLQQVQAIVNGGPDRVRPGAKLRRVVANRRWSVQGVVDYVLTDGLKLLCWARSVKSILAALARPDEAHPDRQPVTRRVIDPATGQAIELVVGYRLDTGLKVYGLNPVLREEAEHQAAEQQRGDKRSHSRQHPGEPLSTDVEGLFQTKVANPSG